MCETCDKRTLSDEEIRKTVKEACELSREALENVSGGKSSSESAKIMTGDTRKHFSTDPGFIHRSIFGSRF